MNNKLKFFLKKCRNEYYRLFHRSICFRGRVHKSISEKANISIDGYLIFNQDMDFKNKGGSYSKIIISDDCTIEIGRNVRFYSNCQFESYNSSKVHIGDNVFFNNNCTLIVRDSVEIGNDTLISQNVVIRDSDVHSIVGKKNHAPIKIGNNVWIGTNVLILKGVTIGDGAVIAAGSVVVDDVQHNCVYAGNPAKMIAKDIIWAP